MNDGQSRATRPRRPSIRRCAAVLGLLPTLLAAPSDGRAADTTTLLVEVHFDVGSADVTIGGQQKIQKAIDAIRKQNPREIHILGFTDTTGDEALNMEISRRRADNVASALSEQGISVPMVIEGKGEHGAPYRIPDDMSEPLNRCVGIIAVGGARQPSL